MINIIKQKYLDEQIVELNLVERNLIEDAKQQLSSKLSVSTVSASTGKSKKTNSFLKNKKEAKNEVTEDSNNTLKLTDEMRVQHQQEANKLKETKQEIVSNWVSDSKAHLAAKQHNLKKTKFTPNQNTLNQEMSNSDDIGSTTINAEELYHKFVEFEAVVDSKWKQQAINGIYELQGLNCHDEPFYLRVVNQHKMFLSMRGAQGSRKWRIGPDCDKESCWIHTKKRTFDNGLPTDGWFQSVAGKWIEMKPIKIRPYNE